MADARTLPTVGAPLPAEATLEAIGIGTFTIDHVTGTITTCSLAFARMFGFATAEAMRGVVVAQHYADPKEREEASARIYGHPDLKRDGYIRFEAQRTRRDGTPIDVLFSLVPTFGADGQVACVSGLAELLSQRRNADKAFRASEERFRALFETSAVGMALATPQGLIVRANAAFCAFLDRAEQDTVGRPLLDFVHPGDYADAALQLALPADGSSPPLVGAQWRFARADVEPVWANVSSSWLVQDGVPHSRVVIVQDVTQQKHMEMLVQRVEKLEAVGLLAGGIAHDFNNLLTGILGSVSLALTDSTLTARTRSSLELAEGSGLRARELTQQLITFAKGGSPVKKAVSIVQIAEQTAAFCLSGARCGITFTVARHLRGVEADAGQLGQMFQNLLMNAAEAMPRGGDIRVRFANADITRADHPVLRAGPYVRIDVEDSGEGISESHLARIFDPYFSTKERGSGLGLATVLSVAQRHGGHVEVRSRLGEGSVFSVFLPASDAIADVPVRAPREATVAHKAGSRVLVMDDEPSVREVAKAALEHAGHTCTTTNDGQEAIAEYERALLAGTPYDVIILDLTVRGGMGGVDALQRIRALDPAVRAIVSSGYSTDPVMADCRAYGFAAVVPKPFTLEQLVQAVRELVAP